MLAGSLPGLRPRPRQGGRVDTRWPGLCAMRAGGLAGMLAPLSRRYLQQRCHFAPVLCALLLLLGPFAPHSFNRIAQAGQRPGLAALAARCAAWDPGVSCPGHCPSGALPSLRSRTPLQGMLGDDLSWLYFHPGPGKHGRRMAKAIQAR